MLFLCINSLVTYVHNEVTGCCNSCIYIYSVVPVAAYRLGSAGKAMAGVEMKIDNPNE